jgi:leader peptidase (prepilin peptidase) / N-methyltransferase
MTSMDLFCILAGFAVGSFIITALGRLGSDTSVTSGPSACDQCSAQLSWYSLIPVMSFLAQRGKCRACHGPISPKYPFAELAGGAIGLLSAVYAPDEMVLVSSLLGWILLALCLHDWMTYRLPDMLTLSLALLGGVTAWLFFRPDWSDHLIGGAAGYISFRLIESLYLGLKGRHGLGRGDTKLFGAIGIWIGWAGLAPALLIASTSALCHVLIESLASRSGLKSTHQIPFGPWLGLGGFIVWLWQISQLA